MIDTGLQRYALLALAAAALFGVSTPLAKILVEGIHPVLLAGLLYLGSGLSLLVVRALRRHVFAPVAAAGATVAAAGETPLARADLPWLAGAVFCGGILAPIALVWGLTGTGAAAGSLLLSTEGVFTTLLAALMFHEAVGLRVGAAALLLCIAGVQLAWNASGTDSTLAGTLSPHALAVVAACALWGLDNNLTRRISAADPVAIAMIKGLTAGTVNCALSLLLGAAIPPAWPLLLSLALGALSYSLSLVLFILALRHLGSARTGAHFSTAPFIGAVFAVVVLGDAVTFNLGVAAALTMVSTWLLLGEQHGHVHSHELLEHSHRHLHDAHHRHAHDGSEGPEPHAHAHVHGALTHSHPHLPDLHHRHDH
jgi:drug/metabolite transporter (DMT)-like permease